MKKLFYLLLFASSFGFSQNIEWENSANGNFIIANPTSETIAYTVSTLNGKIVTQDLSNSSNINVELSNMAHGVYLLQMKANDTIKVLKVVKL